MAIRQQEHPSSEEASEKKKHGTTYMSPEGKEITFVQARDKKLDLDRDVGKMRIIMDSTKESELGGYWCDVCKCSLKDNKSWLDHINGRKHQQHLGHIVRVEQVDANAVKEKFKALKSGKPKVSARDLYLKEKQERLERERREKEEAEAKKREEEEEDEETKRMKDIMGFGGFNSTKKK
ncbi:hypothetical protein WA538_005773 [Blastocystis sp. DL]